MSIHHYMKWHKLGFTRTMDNLSLEIRNNRLTRDEALKIIKKRGVEPPHKDIEKLCNYLGISKDHFYKTCDRFRNKDIWKRDKE